jgi:hypothetical protein
MMVVHNINKLDSDGKSYNSNHGTCNEIKVILKFWEVKWFVELKLRQDGVS